MAVFNVESYEQLFNGMEAFLMTAIPHGLVPYMVCKRIAPSLTPSTNNIAVLYYIFVYSNTMEEGPPSTLTKAYRHRRGCKDDMSFPAVFTL